MIFKAMRMDKITLEEALIKKRKGLRTESPGIPIFTSENLRNNQKNKIDKPLARLIKKKRADPN